MGSLRRRLKPSPLFSAIIAAVFIVAVNLKQVHDYNEVFVTSTAESYFNRPSEAAYLKHDCSRFLPFFQLTPSRELRMSQRLNLALYLNETNGDTANLVLGSLSPKWGPCSPICQRPEYFTHSGYKFECPSYDLLQKYFRHDYAVSQKSKSLAVIIPILDLNTVAEQLANMPACETASQVDIFLIGNVHGITTSPVYKALTSCFSRIKVLPLIVDSDVDAATSLLLQILYTPQIMDNYNYIFWMGPEIMPLRNGWIENLEAETRDASPFLWKGSRRPDQDIKSATHSLFKYMPTADTMALEKNAFIGIWHKGFVSFYRDLLSASVSNLDLQTMLPEASFNDILSWYVFNNNCHAKLFLRYLRYVTFAKAACGSTRIGDEDLFCYKSSIEQCSEENMASFSLNLDYWFPEKEIAKAAKLATLFGNGSEPLDEATLFKRRERYDNFVRNLPSNLLTPEAKNMLQKKCRWNINNAEVHKFLPDDFPSLLDRKEERSKTRILVAMVFAATQHKHILYALSRWEFKDYIPCDGSIIGARFGLMFLQSDLAKDNILEELRRDVEKFPMLSQCFDKLHFNMVDLPKGYATYWDGPANMFKEFILGKTSQDYDYVFQLEPDVLPIRPNWLNKLYLETQDRTPFWVKGSLSMYYDAEEHQGSCLLAAEVSPTHVIEKMPLGAKLLHINGNALYSLGEDFKSLVRSFFEWAKAGTPGAHCDRYGRMFCYKFGHCRGSFDTSLVEFLLFDPYRADLAISRYRFSDFVLNSLDPDYMPQCIPSNTYFIHKPWAFWTGEGKLTCQKQNTADAIIKELDWYALQGQPADIFKSVSDDPKAMIKFVKDTFDDIIVDN